MPLKHRRYFVLLKVSFKFLGAKILCLKVILISRSLFLLTYAPYQHIHSLRFSICAVQKSHSNYNNIQPFASYR